MCSALSGPRSEPVGARDVLVPMAGVGGFAPFFIAGPLVKAPCSQNSPPRTRTNAGEPTAAFWRAFVIIMMMPARPAGRPQHGKVRKDRSKTALFAFVCTELEQRRRDQALLEELDLDLSVTAVEQAVRDRRQGVQGSGRESAAVSGVEPGPLFQAWQLVDEVALGLAAALIQLYPRGETTSRRLREQGELVRWLTKRQGVRQLLSSADGRVLLAVVLYDDRAVRDQLQAALGELGCAWDWNEVSQESWAPATRTWRWLTRRQARRDKLYRPRSS